MDKSAGIEIENIPIGITRDDLVTLFEKELKDENEIKYILFPLSESRSSAFVCFKHSPDKAFIERLVSHNPVWRVSVDARMQTYCCCTAEVDPLIVATLPDIPGCIAMLQKDYGIDASYDDDSGKFLLKGMIHQLQCAQVRLDNIFREQLALQKMQLLQIGKSNDTSVKRSWLDNDDERRGVGSGKMDGKRGSTEDVLKGRRGVVVEDQLEDRQWNRFTEESECRSLPAAPSSLPRGNEDLYRLREYEREPKSSHTYADRTKFLSSFDHDRSNRASGSVSLPYFSDTSERRADDLRRTGDHRLNLKLDKSTGTHSPPEYVSSSDERRHDSHSRPVHSSGLSKKVDASTSSDPGWRKDRVDAADQPAVLRREYDPAYTSKGRASPLSDLALDRDSVSHRDLVPSVWSTSSLSAEQSDRREEVEVDRDSRNEPPAFWKDRLDNSEKLRILPANFFPEVLNSRRSDDPQLKATDRSIFSRFEVPNATNREQHSVEQWSENPREDLDERVSTSSEDEKTLFLETYVVRYIMDIEMLSVQSMKRRYKVEIKVSTEPGADFSMVVFTVLEGPHANQVEKASKKFAELYEETFNGIIQREASVNADLPEVAVVIERVRKMYRVIAITDVAGTVTLVGEFRDVMKAVDTLNGVQAEVDARERERGSGHVDLRMSGRQSGVDRDVDEIVPRRQEKTSLFRGEETSRRAERSDRSPNGKSSELKSSSEKTSQRKEDNFYEVFNADSRTREPRSSASASLLDTNRYMMTFKDDFQVFVYPGDITKMRVDVIVNAANSFLKNYSGVAGAIEEAGGPQFKKDCEDFYNSHGPLEMSEVTHTVATGDLRCRHVIHAVGPQWYFDTDEDKCAASLLTTFTNVLSYAEQTLDAQSLALPAVGTGVYGVPVDLCARAIYRAINEFLDWSSSSKRTLKSIHVVNKDPGTTELIQAVFEGLRQVELDQRMMSRHSRSPSGDERSSEETSSRRPYSERKLVKSMDGRDDTPGRDRVPRRVIAEGRKDSGSHSGFEVDESEVVERRRVDSRRGTGTAGTMTDAVLAKKGFHPIAYSDSD